VFLNAADLTVNEIHYLTKQLNVFSAKPGCGWVFIYLFLVLPGWQFL